MKQILFLCVFAFVVNSISTAQLQCEVTREFPTTRWVDMKDSCITKMKLQIQKELAASIQYLAMGAYFASDSVNRMGFAEFFFDSASEERQHAMKLISYLLMRGELTKDLKDIIKEPTRPSKVEWSDAKEALTGALDLEATVTASIRDVIQVCEGNGKKSDYNDYHLVDYLTGEFLEEQYKGQRELASKISILNKMADRHGVLGEYLYDKQLLSGES